jgi:hypothetical protein
MYICPKCKKEFEKYVSMSRHAGLTHDIPSDHFYVDCLLGGVWPTCKCGCGKKVRWSWQLKGFRSYCQGHQARVHNNWGHNSKAIEASAKTRREQFDGGERNVWNNGLSSLTDERVKRNGEAVSEAFTIDRKRRYSKIMRKNRLDGTVPTLRGSQHSQWRGGVSDINVLARTNIKLYTEWKHPILKRDGFKCVECGRNGNLHIHHNKEQMSEIIQKHLVDGITPKTFEEKEMIAAAIVDYHINNKVSGITLCGRCHKNKHPSLNFR